MRFSIWPSPGRPWEEIIELTKHCEETGWDGVYFADHFMPVGRGPKAVDGVLQSQLRDAVAGELIIPDFTLGTMSSRKDTCDVFMQEVTAQLR